MVTTQPTSLGVAPSESCMSVFDLRHRARLLIDCGLQPRARAEQACLGRIVRGLRGIDAILRHYMRPEQLLHPREILLRLLRVRLGPRELRLRRIDLRARISRRRRRA